jgi:hypothetical protein
VSVRGHVLPALMIVVGLALLVRTLAGGGGPAAVGIVLGVLFCAAGTLRLYAETRKPGA